MDKAEIERRLRVLPREASVAFAVRVAMRWLPFLSVMLSTDVLARLGIKCQAAFFYWREEEKRQPYLLAILHAQANAVGVGLGSAIARKNAFPRRRAAYDAAGCRQEWINISLLRVSCY
jgi:hypothetical protein